MALSVEQKKAIVESYQSEPGDSGSVEVQVALLTENIKGLTRHFETHAKDLHSRRGLQFMINRRRKLLNYLKKKHFSRYQALIKCLGLRH